ncbi:MAG: H(+)/Cl(-) exchange transporter ClcA [Snowella sp.]|nr:H(+)/Cl(-) exchange transporter ClcA [Snowella sp.]
MLNQPHGPQERPNVSQRFYRAAEKLNVPVLLWSVWVGILAGLMGGIFELSINTLLHQRELLAQSLTPYPWLYWTIPSGLAAVMVAGSFWLMRKFAPETSGGGIPQIEGYIDGLLPLNWKRVLPIKFLGGILSLGGGMVNGFEGPTIQIGGSIGQMIGNWFKANPEQVRMLVASGAGAGLTTAFNAPLAGIIFVFEEMHPGFADWPLAYRSTMIASAIATIVERALRGQGAVVSLTKFSRVPLESLWIFVLLGVFFGVLGYLFNHYLLRALDWFSNRRGATSRFIGVWVGLIMGFLALVPLPITGTGENAIIWAFNSEAPSYLLILVFIARLGLTIFCYGSGVIGGVFQPMLAIATVASLGFAREIHAFFPQQLPEPSVMAIAGMGALVAATVRAPLTAILLTIEMTDNYFVILPLLITCLTATMIAHLLGGEPIYSVLLKRTCEKRSQLLSTSPPPDQPH